jgi:hypothetical protein
MRDVERYIADVLRGDFHPKRGKGVINNSRTLTIATDDSNLKPHRYWEHEKINRTIKKNWDGKSS